MSPRPGGEADKFGNRYEGVWTVQQLLHILRGAATSITVEDVGDLGDGVEFTFRRGGLVEVHQLKRQLADANSWTPKALHNKGVLESAKAHVEGGRHFVFVSMIPCRPLAELADRARRSSDVDSFVREWLTQKLRPSFDELTSSAIYGSPEVAWKTLRGFWVEWPDERNLTEINSALADLLLEGATGRLAAVALGDMVVHNLGVELNAAAIREKLSGYGLRLTQEDRALILSDRVRDITSGWTAGIGQAMLQPAIARSETYQLDSLLDGENRLLLLVGDAGAGKSVVLHDTTLKQSSKSVTTLCLRLDRLDPFNSTTDLGKQLGLNVSPVAALAAAAGGRRALLVVDQVDAVSLASGRMPRSFSAVADMIREASAFNNMRVLLACRKFDVDNDYRIRELVQAEKADQVVVGKLTEEQVTTAVGAMGLDQTTLSREQLELLRVPLHLVLLKSVEPDANAMSFRTAEGLFDAYWERKRLDCAQRRDGSVRFAEVVYVLAGAISARQRPSVHVSVFDQDELGNDAQVLVSEHVITKEGQQVGFFHESFFSYVFARRWMNSGQGLIEFLASGEQELFRRSQVRQILNYLRDKEPALFVAEVEDLLTNTRIRFHVKDVVLGIVRSLPNPSAAEWEMVHRVLGTHPPFSNKLWLSLRNVPWFDRLDEEGVLGEWLAEDDGEEGNRAIDIMIGGVKAKPDRIAALLAPHQGRAGHYSHWLLCMVRFADVHQSRQLFNLLLGAIRSGEIADYGHNLWLFTYDLAKHQPTWAVELLAVHLVLRPNALALDDDGNVAALIDQDDALIRLVTQAASGAPRAFCETLVPYLLAVMKVTAKDREDHLQGDAHFSFRYPSPTFHDLDDALLFSAAGGLRTFTGADPDAARPLLETLAAAPHDAAQWLLYEGLRGDAAMHHASWVASLLQEGRTRLLSGYASNGVWTTRQLLQAASAHFAPEAFAAVERTILNVRFPWEGRRPGWYAFNLLSAMEETRLSEAGGRRLGELRRLAGRDQPDPARSVEVGIVQSPIAPESAQRMRDDNWLQAIATHDSEHERGRMFQGGAAELSHVLRQETGRDPGRFARLALRLRRDVNPAYTVAILMGLADGEPLADAGLVFNAVRHIASLRLAPNDRWLGQALRRYLKNAIPDDIILSLVDRSLNAEGISPDRWEDYQRRNERGLHEAIYTVGINTARGSCAEALADILIYDTDGTRTSLAVPSLERLAGDSSIAVRACVARTIAACLRHARSDAVRAFERLIQADDRLLAVHTVRRLMLYVGNGDPSLVLPLVGRMVASEVSEVREAGGGLAAFAGLEWGSQDLLSSVAGSADWATRKGVAEICAHWLPHTSDARVAGQVLQQLMNDDNDDVREAAAKVAGCLRGQHLRPFSKVLSALIGSLAFSHAVPQLLITLEHAPDRVDDLVLACARRFVEVHGADIGNIATGAAGDASSLGKLVLRAYAQATSSPGRREALDNIDRLLRFNAVGFADLIEAAEL